MTTLKHIAVFDTLGELNEASAKFILAKTEYAIKTKGKCSIALSGGNTPQQLFRLLSEPPYDSLIQWERVFVFWADERCVPLDDVRNNAYMAKTLLLDKVRIPATNIYRVPSDIDPEKAAGIYEDNIRFFFKGHVPSFDLILLGLGENGHTASLFPYTEPLHTLSRLVMPVYIEREEMHRITMTPFLINIAHHILFLVSGTNKSEITSQIINGDFDPDRYPAQMIDPLTGDLYWYLDKEAAKLL